MKEKKIELGICVICGKTLKPNFYLCMNCSPNMYKKQSFSHQKIRRTKKWSENREKRLKQANNKCDKCGVKIPDPKISPASIEKIVVLSILLVPLLGV